MQPLFEGCQAPLGEVSFRQNLDITLQVVDLIQLTIKP